MMEHDCEKENGGVLSECSVRYCVLALTLQHFLSSLILWVKL